MRIFIVIGKAGDGAESITGFRSIEDAGVADPPK
jgi:hypothetical protein